MPAGFQSSRDITHYARVFRLADDAGLAVRPDLAETRMALFWPCTDRLRADRMDRRPTIIDVAQRAGVSKSTVSLVLQNSPLVRPETRDDVRRAMAEIGYVYNRSAANLRSANAGLIGLVINDLRNPFFTEFATSVQMALSASGYATVIANTDEDPALQAQVVGAMLEHGVSALIVSPAYGDEAATFDAIARARIPALQVLRRVADSAAFPFAAPDYATGSRLATEHLLAQGAADRFRRRACRPRRDPGADVGLPGNPGRPRDDAAAPARPPRPRLRPRGGAPAGRRPSGHRCGAVLQRPDGAWPDVGLRRAGPPVGTALKIVGFDDIEDCAQVFPALASVRCDIAGFGRAMAETVLKWLEEDHRPAPETVTPVTLIPRASSIGP
jgi:LacI family transcriptional regulator